mmetsp:Transcript_19534/g.19821  ORF Transcript_19534/g.19821 Transcript_19534/m.19821 type:complete len:133 (-) Transcript_19534:216-614(-)
MDTTKPACISICVPFRNNTYPFRAKGASIGRAEEGIKTCYDYPAKFREEYNDSDDQGSNGYFSSFQSTRAIVQVHPRYVPSFFCTAFHSESNESVNKVENVPMISFTRNACYTALSCELGISIVDTIDTTTW